MSFSEIEKLVDSIKTIYFAHKRMSRIFEIWFLYYPMCRKQLSFEYLSCDATRDL